MESDKPSCSGDQKRAISHQSCLAPLNSRLEPPQIDAFGFLRAVKLRLNIQHDAMFALEKFRHQRPAAADVILVADRKDYRIGRLQRFNRDQFNPVLLPASIASTPPLT